MGSQVSDNLLDDLAGLVAKSLVWVRAGPDGLRYRLSDTLRSYAREKIAEDGPARHTESAALASTGWTHRPCLERRFIDVVPVRDARYVKGIASLKDVGSPTPIGGS